MMVERDAIIRKLETSIASVIGEVVPLKKRGRYYEACCPFHDDSTPSMTVHDNESNAEPGWFNCFGCGAAGDVYDFLQRYHGVSFLDAVHMLGGEAHVRISDLHDRPVRASDKQKWVERIWSSCTEVKPCSSVGDYLASRAIPVGDLGELPNLGETKLQYRNDGNEHPVLVAAIRDRKDQLIGVQRIYLTADGTKLPVKSPRLSLGNIRGGAIKIGSSLEELIICEGVEDALSIRLACGEKTVWAAAGGNMMASMPIPDECTRLTIAQDNDAAGRASAKAAAKAFKRSGRNVLIMSPSPEFKDFNDELKASTIV
jgi:DNA primase